jgi:DNA-binding NarL/FixJ family response regulator
VEAALRILIADPHDTMRSRLRSLLESQPEVEVCEEAADGSHALKKIRELKPDLVVLEYDLPLINGLIVARMTRQISPETRILIMVLDKSRELIQQARNAGAHGFVEKAEVGDSLLKAIQAIRQIGTYFPPD